MEFGLRRGARKIAKHARVESNSVLLDESAEGANPSGES